MGAAAAMATAHLKASFITKLITLLFQAFIQSSFLLTLAV